MTIRLFGTLLFTAMFALPLAGCAGPVQITSGNTNQCINVENHGYPVPGTPLHVRSCDPWQNQKWVTSDGMITGVGGFCVDIQGSLAVDGSPVVYVPCDGRPSQQWTVTNGIILGLGGKCIDISGGAPTEQAPLVLATCNGSPSQQWSLH